MPFPAGTPVVTLTGTIPAAVGGTPFSGSIILTPSATLVDSTRHAIYPGGGVQPFDTNGTVSVQVIPNNAAGIAPTGWRWQVDVQPTGGRRITFWADIHGNNGDTVQLDSLIPVPAPDGTTGGTAGTAGASAYELALANGFVGTVTQWLASLVGPAGATGATGPAGPTGATGATGAQGRPDRREPQARPGQRETPGPLARPAPREPQGCSRPSARPEQATPSP
ncbi:hypothetical protein O1L68_05790 [Streptomyces lydicus]|nr:hypothetical protein [Streptomyces lydicus]